MGSFFTTRRLHVHAGVRRRHQQGAGPSGGQHVAGREGVFVSEGTQRHFWGSIIPWGSWLLHWPLVTGIHQRGRGLHLLPHRIRGRDGPLHPTSLTLPHRSCCVQGTSMHCTGLASPSTPPPLLLPPRVSCVQRTSVHWIGLTSPPPSTPPLRVSCVQRTSVHWSPLWPPTSGPSPQPSSSSWLAAPPPPRGEAPRRRPPSCTRAWMRRTLRLCRRPW